MTKRKFQHFLTASQRKRLKALVEKEGVTRVRQLFGVSAETLDKAFFCADGKQVRGWRKSTYDHIVQQLDFFA